MDYERMDLNALNAALVRLGVCPRCRRDLQPVGLVENVMGCPLCKETWHVEVSLPDEPKEG